MERLKSFSKYENLKKKIIIGIYAFLIIGIILTGTTYAVYQKTDEVLFINARVGEFKENDIQLAMKLDGEQVEAPPEKNSLYTVTVDCDNATGEWDSDRWAAIVGNITSGKVKCEVNFATPEPTLSEVTATAEKTSISLSYTAGGIGTTTTCVYGTEEGNYTNSVEEVQNTSCNITGLEMDTTYYYKVCAKNATGEVCKEGSVKTKPNTTPFSQSDVGKYVSMTPTSTSYTIATATTGYTSTQTINPSELNLWRIIKVNSDGTVEMVSDKVSSTLVYFRGSAGYLNLVGGLNTIAAQYTDGTHVKSTRHMGYSNQKETCSGPLRYKDPGDCDSDTGYQPDLQLVNVAYGGSSSCTSSCAGLKANKVGTTTATAYWLASRDFSGGSYYDGRCVNSSGGSTSDDLYIANSDGTNDPGNLQYAVRPIVTLKSTSEISSGSGTSSSPYKLN